MERMNNRGIRTREVAREIFIVFDDTSRVARGHVGCNTFRATYCRKEGWRLSFSGLDATKRTCPDVYVEAMFFKMMEETNGYSLKRDRLCLKKDDETIAVFRPGGHGD
jgi:heat shock protein HslJ